jgi:16S rRNA processing protein RimM
MHSGDPDPDELLLIGYVVAAFGMRGQFKLRAITDRPDYLQKRIRTIYIGTQYKYTPYQLHNVFQHKPQLLVMTVQGITKREHAEDLRGAEVFILETDAAPLGTDEYYIHQLYNLRVETTEGAILGYVQEVIATGSNEVLVVRRPDQPDALIPMIHDVVQTLDVVGQRIIIRLLPGLVE